MGPRVQEGDAVSAESLSARISALAKKLGLALHKVSVRADLDPSTLRKAQKMGTKVRPDNLRGVARVLEVPYLHLLFEQEDVTSADLQEYLNWSPAQKLAP